MNLANIIVCLKFYGALTTRLFELKVQCCDQYNQAGYQLQGFPRFYEGHCFVNQYSIPFVRHFRPQIFCDNHWCGKFLFDGELNDIKKSYPCIYSYHNFSTCMKSHMYMIDSCLTLNCCQGISNTCLDPNLNVSEHFCYIDEYS